MLDTQNSLLLVIDVQERLVAALDKDIIVNRAGKLVEAANILNIPVIVSEQYPKGLGNTVPQVASKLDSSTYIIEKTSFSLLREDGFLEKLKSYGRKQIVICGIEIQTGDRFYA